MDAINKMLFWSTQAREKALHYEHAEIGYNYRLSNICAGIGRGQLKILDLKISRRKEIFNRYLNEFRDASIKMMPISEKGMPNYWLSVVTIDPESNILPDYIVGSFAELAIETRPAWKPMHMQPVFADCVSFGHEEGQFICEEVFRYGLCLPSGDALEEEEQQLIIRTLMNIDKRRGIA
jgi:pyridoxal phosphate-dependent aminotransferase EpsN